MSGIMAVAAWWMSWTQGNGSASVTKTESTTTGVVSCEKRGSKRGDKARTLRGSTNLKGIAGETGARHRYSRLDEPQRNGRRDGCKEQKVQGSTNLREIAAERKGSERGDKAHRLRGLTNLREMARRASRKRRAQPQEYYSCGVL